MPNKIAPGTETKKEMIAKLLLDNNKKYLAREIARIVRTTEGNVFKEKSNLKATGALLDKDVAVLSQSNETDTLTLSHRSKDFDYPERVQKPYRYSPNESAGRHQEIIFGV